MFVHDFVSLLLPTLCLPSESIGIRAACPLLLCVLAHLRCTRSPALVGVPPAPRAVPLQGAYRAVPCRACPCAFPALVPCAVYLVWGGGAVPVPASTCLAPGCSPARGWARAGLAPGGGLAGGEGGWVAEGGGAACALPPGNVAVPGLVGEGIRGGGRGTTPQAGRLLVRSPASSARAPRPASSAAHRSWSMRSQYCSGSGLCALARAPPKGAPPGGGVPWRPIRGPNRQAWGSSTLQGGGLSARRRAYRGLRRLWGKLGGNGQGARGRRTQRCAWRGSLPRVSGRRGVDSRRPFGGGEGGFTVARHRRADLGQGSLLRRKFPLRCHLVCERQRGGGYARVRRLMNRWRGEQPRLPPWLLVSRGGGGVREGGPVWPTQPLGCRLAAGGGGLKAVCRSCAPGASVSASVSAAVRARVPCATARRHARPAVPPHACPQPLSPTTARIGGYGPDGAPHPRMSWRASGSGWDCSGTGSHLLLGGHLGSLACARPPSAFAIGPPGGGPSAWPLPAGLAVTCATAFVVTGVAAVAGSSGGGASG